MATKKDLVEAYSFGRRRLVTAFVSGAPGGREVEPSRPGRTIVGGLALAMLLAAGAAIAGVLAPRTPDGWTTNGLIVSKETGQAYVILPGADGSAPEPGEQVELRPVINITSATLILGADVEPMLISQDTIDDQRIGDDIGILGAPASLPAPDRLVETGWTSCTGDDRGMRVRVAVDPDVRPAPDAAQVVEVDGSFYLIASERLGDDPAAAYALRLPGGDTVDNLLGALDLPARVFAPSVPRGWLDLFPFGAALDWESFGLGGVGERPDAWDAAGVPGRARVGDVLRDADGDAVVLTEDGPADLDPFALAVYANTRTPGRGTPRVLPVDRFPDLARTRLPGPDRRWPTAPVEETVTDPCAVLVAAGEGAAVVQLAQGPGTGFDARDVLPGHAEVGVDPGRGAYVLSASPEGARDPQPVVIDAKGRANPLDGDGTADLLGYADFPAPVVPDTWVKLFGAGVPLSQNLALCPPAPAGAQDGPSCA
ncbi:type VII secretion protein EccB [Nocardioides sp.]|uniref:type VII secretion protein EccB n=1 Tax=Nocardioides sp. TaxID=35761 RepID=UPI0026184A2F|nr:type VII secretion protein EccB [Nocardioides sp.]MDI6910509.1 type VII secretion protein EccB [Nocardioides sp.]